MDLSLTPNHVDAICIDHVLPTSTGAHIHTESISSRNADPKVRQVADLPGVEGHIYLSFGSEIDSALANVTAAPGTVRGQAVMFQFMRGLPTEVADRSVVRLRNPEGLSLHDVAARADVAGLPVEIYRSDLGAAKPGEAAFDPGRLIGFDTNMRITPVANAEILWVTPLKHWAPDAYAGAGTEAMQAALLKPYPLARMVSDGANGVTMGMPPALVQHLYGGDLAQLSRPLSSRDIPDVPGQRIGGYGDLIAVMATPGTRGFVSVSTPSGANLTFLAQHDQYGVSYLDLGTGGAAVFPPAQSKIDFYSVEGAANLPTWLEEIRSSRPNDAAMRPISHSSSVHALPISDTGRSVDVIGSPFVLTERFRSEITAAAAGVDAPVVVIATDKPSSRPSKSQLFDLEWQLFQHRQNQRAGGDAPIVVIQGAAPPAITGLLDGYEFAVVQQPRTSGGGLSLNLDNRWSGTDAAGNPLASTVPKITADFLRAVGAARVNSVSIGAAPDERLMSFLSTPLDDVSALKNMLAEQRSALKGLLPQIGTLGTVQKDLFAGWEAIFRIDARPDDAMKAAAYEYLGAGDARNDKALSFVPSLLRMDPASRSAGLADLIDLTKGPLDDGASRAILGAIKARIEGGSLEEMKAQIYKHSVYLPEKGRTDWIRRLQDLMRQQPEHSQLFEQAAVFVETCP